MRVVDKKGQKQNCFKSRECIFLSFSFFRICVSFISVNIYVSFFKLNFLLFLRFVYNFHPFIFVSLLCFLFKSTFFTFGTMLHLCIWFFICYHCIFLFKLAFTKYCTFNPLVSISSTKHYLQFIFQTIFQVLSDHKLSFHSSLLYF